MKLALNQLSRHVTTTLAPIYLLSGDEILLQLEAVDAIRQAAQQQGYHDRQQFQHTSSFDWQQLMVAANSQSLFSSQSLLELTLPTGKPGDKGAKMITAYAANPPKDKVLLITTPKLPASSTKTTWVKAIERVGVSITIWPIKPEQLPQWLTQRLHKVGLKATHAAALLLAERFEGNLLAASQAIEKLRLHHGDNTTLSEADIAQAVSDHARFDVFSLVDHAVAGNPRKVLRIFNAIQAEAGEPTVILWALSREIRQLSQMAVALQKNTPLSQVMQQHHVWEKRKPLVKKALARHTAATLAALLQRASQIDSIIKGATLGDKWLALEQLSLQLAGLT